MKVILRSFLLQISLIVTLWLPQFAVAGNSPVVMLENATNQMIQSLHVHKATIRRNPNLVDSFVKQHLLPLVDVDNMSRSVLGRQVWTTANATQQAQFTREFQKLVIRTYSAAMSQYDEQQVIYAPIRGGYQGRRFIQVNSIIKQRSASPIRVNYRLVLHNDQWKVYDFSVDGISMVQSYRSQFAPIVSKKGMDGLLSELKSHNRS